MKRTPLILLIYPCLVLILLTATVLIFKDWWRVSFTGLEADGRIKAVLFLRENGDNGLLSGIDTQLSLQRANGENIKLFYRDYGLVRAVGSDGEYPVDAAGGVALSGNPEADSQLSAELARVVSGKNDVAGWFLLRQKRAGEAHSFVTLEKTETAYFWEGLPDSLKTFTLSGETGRVVPVGIQNGAESSRLVTTARFSYVDEEAFLERRGEMLVHYERMLDGRPVDEGKREFVIYNEPYWTAQYPVFVYETAAGTHAVLSDIGRHGDPSLAFPIFAEVTVDYLPDDPGSGLMNGKLTPKRTDEKFLNWFSRASEIYLTRWIYPGMFILCTGILLLVSALFISMLIHPPGKLPPVPETKE